MNNIKLYVFLSQLCGYLGIGVILGYILGEGSSRTAVWVAGILIFVAAVFIGMSIATPKPEDNEKTAEEKSSTNKSSKKKTR